MNKKNVLIIGGEISGVGAAKLANKMGYNIIVTSTKKIDNIQLHLTFTEIN